MPAPRDGPAAPDRPRRSGTHPRSPEAEASESSSEPADAPAGPRFFSVAEANEAVALVAERMPRLREAVHRWKFASEQVADLETMWQGRKGGGLEDTSNPDRAEYERLLGEAGRAEKEARRTLETLTRLGIEIKDPTIGLADFPARRANGEVVYLCWREGEREIVAWHPIVGGFAARRPMREF